ncbi:MAG: DUF3488 and transglutaminase-like domain-containing protein [Deltaproteobacteria bacterium]
MKFSTYFILLSYLMAGTGLLSVGLTGIMGLPFFALITGITVFSFFINIKGKTLRISKFIWNGLALIILPAALADYFFISMSLIDVSIRFLTILMAAKLFDLRTNRDHAILYILTFFQLLAAAVSTINISFLFVLALYILIGIWTLTIFNLKKEWEEKSLAHGEIGRNILSPYFFIATAGLAALSLIITLSLFFVIPRMGVGLFPRKTADTLKVSGFSETMDLGDLGPVKLDPTIIMRVELHDYKVSATPHFYFRGMAFDSYNGMQWQQTDTTSGRINLARRDNGIFASETTAGTAARNLLKQVVLLEPVETSVLFAATAVVGIAGNFKNVAADKAGAFYLPAPSYSRIEYTAYSAIPSPPENTIPDGEYLKDVPAQYLHLPSGFESVQLLARKITADKKTPMDAAIAIGEYLKNNYRYNLSPAKGEGRDPLDDFLFYAKEGYCEQYATAMAVMLRTIGIPTRLVTGFLPGEWNRVGNYFIIRGRDAHSWVEAYMPNSGWVTFDPTPSVEAAGITMPAKTPAILLYVDMLKWKWNRYIINYSFTDQIKLSRAVEEKGRLFLADLMRSLPINKLSAANSRQKVAYLSIVAVTVAILIFIIIIMTAQKLKNDAGWLKIPMFYKNMMRLLAKRGKIKNAGDTALEFADAVNIEEVKAITDIYYKVRFGGYRLTDEEKGDIAVYLENIKSKK